MDLEIRFFYLSSKLTKTIIKSQVVNWIKILNSTKKVKFEIIFLVPIIDFFKKKCMLEYKQIENDLQTRVHKIPILRTKWNLWIEQLLLYYFLLFKSKIESGSKYSLAIQTRNNKFTYLIKSLRRKRKVFFFYEHRGVGAEEYINGLGYKSIHDISDKRLIKNYFKKISEYNNIFRQSDAVINVSEKMKLYVLNTFRDIEEKKLKVIPGSADETIFFYDENLRKSFRRKLLFEDDDIVFLYTGKLEQKWHMSNFLFEVLKFLQKNIEKFRFLCLTPDIEIANSLIIRHELDRNQILLSFIEHNNVNAYLNAADFGLVFREEISTNIHSSPTKIAEYLLAGLPIILSNNIGDYSDFIQKHSLGFVCDNSISSINSFLCNNSVTFHRKSNSLIANAYYSKQSQIKKYIEIYEDTLGPYLYTKYVD